MSVEDQRTNGSRSSERKACYHAFFVSIVIAIYGIYKEAPLSDLAILIGAVCSPLMWYAGARSYVKGKRGENESQNQ